MTQTFNCSINPIYCPFSTPAFVNYVYSPGYIYATCIFLQLVQSYGLRMRHVVAGCYYPEREKLRAVWLYNHILKRRGSFITVIRRNLHLGTEEGEEKHTLLSLVAAKWVFTAAYCFPFLLLD